MTQANPSDREYAGLFGYVTPEDYDRWSKQRAAREKRVGAIRAAMAAAGESLTEMGQQDMRARLAAAHKVGYTEAHDNSRKDQSKADPSPRRAATRDWERPEKSSDNDLEL